MVLLFNMVGYRAWFYYAEKASDAAMETRLDKNQYEENDLVSLTIPLNNPYQLEQANFESVSGEINFQGKNFRIVKRKVSGGNLILQCIPDTHKMILKKAKTEYGNAANDLTNNGKSSSRSGLQKSFISSDYETHPYNFLILNFSDSAPKQNGYLLSIYADVHLASPGKPPQLVA